LKPSLLKKGQRRNVARIAAFTLPLTWLIGSGVAFSAEPKEWLARMNKALTTQNYVGVFTHVHGGRVETLRIIHRVRGGDVSERLLSLDGSGREFIREGNELIHFPDRRSPGRAPRSRRSHGALPSIDEDNSLVYEIRGGERQRLLGRDTRVVALQPRDQYRYGYRLWIDEKTSMPLKTQLCNQAGEVIEQIVFSAIDLPERISDSMFKPQVDASNYRWFLPIAGWQQLRPRCGTPCACLPVPHGHALAQSIPGQRAVAHIVYTDGIASCRCSSNLANDTKPAEGPSRVGTSSAFLP
jgi:sigma-E factor negative regulatory protein RseB